MLLKHKNKYDPIIHGALPCGMWLQKNFVGRSNINTIAKI